MEAVLLSYEEYEHLKNIEEAVEQLEIKNMVEKRLEKYDPRNNIPWENIREEPENRIISFKYQEDLLKIQKDKIDK
jgi:hypothetical protein